MMNLLLLLATAIICALPPHVNFAQIMRANIGSESCHLTFVRHKRLIIDNDSKMWYNLFAAHFEYVHTSDSTIFY